MLVLAITSALLYLFWYPTFRCNFSGLDEFCTFICFSKANDIRSLLNFFVTPHNQHFAPVFKVLFFAEYKMFGLNPTPYHMVSTGLFIASAWLLWMFIKKETGDNAASALCSLAYATNSAYFTVVSWVFAQQIILTFIFIQLSLLSLQNRQGWLAMAKAAAFCLLASLCLNYGGAAWLFCAIFLFFRDSRAIHANEEHSGAGLKKYALLIVSASITMVLYSTFYIDTSSEYGTIPLNPLIYLQGTLVFIGKSTLKSLGLLSLEDAASLLAGRGSQSLPVAVKVLSHLCFIAAAIIGAVYYNKLSRSGKRLAISAFSIAGISTVAIIGARGAYYGLDIYKLTDTGRYTYFPLAFLTIGAAPYISALSSRRKLILFLLLPVWLSLHIMGLNRGLTAEEPAVRLLDKTLFIASSSLDHPVEMDERGNIYTIDMIMKGSRVINNFRIIPGRQISNVDMLRLFLGPDDLLAEAGGTTLLMRHSRRLGPGDIRSISPRTSIEWDRNMVHISRDAEIALMFAASTTESSGQGQYILSFMAKAGQKGTGTVFCLTGEESEPERFNIPESFFLNAYQVSIPCSRYEDAVIFLRQGDYTLDNIKIYW